MNSLTTIRGSKKQKPNKVKSLNKDFGFRFFLLLRKIRRRSDKLTDDIKNDTAYHIALSSMAWVSTWNWLP